MTTSKHTAAIAVMTDTRAYERSRMATVRAAAQLVLTMTEAHEQAGLEFHEGQRELMQAGRLVADETALNAPVAKLHRELAMIGVRRGLDWRMGGDLGNTNFDEVAKELIAAGEHLAEASETAAA